MLKTINSDRWERMQALFHGAADLPVTEQLAYRDDATKGDESLIAEVLLAAGQTTCKWAIRPTGRMWDRQHSLITSIKGIRPGRRALSGAPGAVVGWGFTLFNDTDSISPAARGNGTYVDYFQTNYDVVGPSPESTGITQTFDPVAITGVGGFDIWAATSGSESDGVIQLTYDLYSADPNTDPNPGADLVTSGNVISANVSIAVVPASMAVPEPALGRPAGLLCVGICLCRQLSRIRRELPFISTGEAGQSS